MSDQVDKLSLYQCFVGTITAAEQRRQQSSGVYVSLLSAGVAILGVSKTIDPLYIVIPASFVCLIWFTHVYYFRNLSIAKFHVINEIEKSWDIKPFSMEWTKLEDLKEKKAFLRIGLTRLEMLAPISIGIVSVVYILYRAFPLVVACFK